MHKVFPGALVLVACSTAAIERPAAAMAPEIALGASVGPDGGAATPTISGGEPSTCEEAALARSYLGCEFWPTVTFNIVDPTFDFAAVVSNPQRVDVQVSVSGPYGELPSTLVKAGATTRIFLPWVAGLKTSPERSNGKGSSVKVGAGAYRLRASAPVVAYQFNPLQYKSGT